MEEYAGLLKSSQLHNFIEISEECEFMSISLSDHSTLLLIFNLKKKKVPEECVYPCRVLPIK